MWWLQMVFRNAQKMAFNENALILLHHFFRAMVTLSKYLQAKDKSLPKLCSFLWHIYFAWA